MGLNPARGMDVCPRLSVLCYLVYVEALRRTDPSSKESYQLSKNGSETSHKRQQRFSENCKATRKKKCVSGCNGVFIMCYSELEDEPTVLNLCSPESLLFVDDKRYTD
jgi:hypothetical protein